MLLFSWNYYQSRPQQHKPKTSITKPQPVSAEPYETLWSRVDSLEKKGLNKSALTIVMKHLRQSENREQASSIGKGFYSPY